MLASSAARSKELGRVVGNEVIVAEVLVGCRENSTCQRKPQLMSVDRVALPLLPESFMHPDWW